MPKRRRTAPADACRVVGYVRVSTDEQAASGLGLDAQRAAIDGECERRGWELVGVAVDAGVSGSAAPEARPGFAEALDLLDRHQAGTLMVAKLDRLARSTLDLCRLIDADGWNLAAADGTVDTTTPHGRAMAQMVGVFAELERSMIAERTRAALAAKKAQGARLGRPVTLPDELRTRIADERNAGATLQAIADGLNAEGIPTAQGGACWYPSSVRSVLLSLDRDAEAAAARAA